jgi:hypothetical protein
MESLIIDLQNDLSELNNKEIKLKTFPVALTSLAADCSKTVLTDRIQREMYDFNIRYPRDYANLFFRQNGVAVKKRRRHAPHPGYESG